MLPAADFCVCVYVCVCDYYCDEYSLSIYTVLEIIIKYYNRDIGCLCVYI